MGSLVSGGSTPPTWTSELLHSLVSFFSFLLSNPNTIAILLTLALVPLVLWIDTIGKNPTSSLNKMPVKDSSGDFKGDVKVNNNPPTKGDLEKVADLPVLDKDRKKYTFKSLYADNENGPRRVLIIFIRHFFCGVCTRNHYLGLAVTGTDNHPQNCQEYLRTFASSITPESLSALSPPTEILVIGCGQPHLIPMYIEATGCPYPIYADPTRRLYHLLRMTSTLNPGKTPEYMQRSFLSMAVKSFLQELKSGRNMLSGGDFRQVGGEFLFQNGKVTWCRRMRNTRDHAEVPIVRQQLGLDDTPTPQRKRWSAAAIGGGITRRLSNRRPMSWAGGPRSKSGNRVERPASGMDFLKEDDGEKLINGNGVASGHDVDENGTATKRFTTNGAATNGVAPNGAATNGTANGAAVNGFANGGTVNGRAILERINFDT
ncbi:MAG: hypothetical protein Q9161_005947 [Pseudevernia consocians]